MRGDYKNRSAVFLHTDEGMKTLREICNNELCKIGNVFRSNIGTLFVEILMRDEMGDFKPAIVIKEGDTVTRSEASGFGSYLTISTKALYMEEGEHEI